MIRSQDFLGSFAISVHKKYKLARRIVASLKPCCLDETFSHLGVERPVTRWYSHFYYRRILFSKMQNQMRKSASLGFP